MEKKEFLKTFNLTEDEFYGRKIIDISLNLSRSDLKYLPEGFNPKVNGHLWLYDNELEYLPKSFNPVITGYLSLSYNKLKELPKNFNPIVEGNLWLSYNEL